MKRIGVLSDTHGTVPSQVYSFFENCDEIWHAGDMGAGVLDQLRTFKPVVGVYGNMDGYDVRFECPETVLFSREGKKILMTHIGGYPGRYEATVRLVIQREKPDIFVCGHSHILKVMWDKDCNLLHINPGAAGRQGFQKVSTLVRFTLDPDPKDLEILEFDKFPKNI